MLFEQAGKTKGHIPICGKINGEDYKQTLVKYKGEWRLYVNNSILKNSPKRIGETLTITIEYDTDDRTLTPDPKFIKALNQNKNAKLIFDKLTPSLQKEIIRYIGSLKSEESKIKNINKAIGFLSGKNRFVGREPLKAIS
jgi:Bacteriocin-protection, YdeI or OmpD-Associated/Domain of unknown function (DUF1905)